MKYVEKEDRNPCPVGVEGAEGVRMVGLVTGGDGSPTASMRLFEIDPGGHTPWHTHDWEHVIYVLEGQGRLRTEHGDADFGPGDSLLAEPNEQHNFVNTGEGTLRFLCIVPLKGDG
jgi:quercetin dioxygenase-like cupin family protein